MLDPPQGHLHSTLVLPPLITFATLLNSASPAANYLYLLLGLFAGPSRIRFLGRAIHLARLRSHAYALASKEPKRDTDAWLFKQL